MNIKDNINLRGRAITKVVAAAAVALCVGLTSCSDSDDNVLSHQGGTPVSISGATIGASSDIGTRATDTSWEAGDAFSLIMADPIGYSIDSKFYRYVTANGDGSFAPDGENNTAYYPANGKAVEVYAVYPTQSSAIAYSFDNVGFATASIDVSSQTDLAAIDLMAATTEGTHSSENPDVKLAFRHLLSKLTLALEPAEGADIDLSGATLVYSGAYTRAKYVVGGTLTTDYESKGNIAMPLVVSDGGKKAQAAAIVLPIVSMQGSTFTITIPGKDGKAEKVFTAKPGNLALNGGTANKLTITLQPDAMEAVISGVSIEDWTTGTAASLLAIEVADPDASDPTHGNFKPLTGDSLFVKLTNTANAEENVQGDYLYNATTDRWESAAPLVWDFLTRDATYKVDATFVPQAADIVTGERDVLISDMQADFGAPINLTGDNSLRHALSKLSVKVVNNATNADGTPMALTAARIDGLLMTQYAADGSFSVAPSTKAYKNFMLHSDALDRGEERLVCPQTVSKDAALVLYMGGEEHSVNLSKNIEALVAGTHHVLTVTVESTIVPGKVGDVEVAVSIVDWTYSTADLAHEVVVKAPDGVGGVSFADFAEGTLTFTMTNTANANEVASGTYTYDAEAKAWTSQAPIYWDNLTEGATYKVDAVYQPGTADAITGESATMKATTTVAYAAAIDLTGDNALKHEMSKLGIKVLNGLTDAEVTAISLTGIVNAEGKAYAALSYDPATCVGKDAAGESHIIAPQTLTDAAKVVITAGGKDYTVALKSNDLAALVAGTHHTVVISLYETHVPGAVGDIKASIGTTDWAAATINLAHEVVIKGADGVGGVSFADFAEGTLTFTMTNTANANEVASGTYTYDAEAKAWTSQAPIYWDNLTQGATYNVTATYTPATADAVTKEADVLENTISVAFGADIDFSGNNALKHKNSKLTLKVVDANNFGISKVEVTGLGNYTNFTYTATGVATGESHLVAPQKVGADVKIVITSNKGNTYSYALSNGIAELLAGTNHTLTLSLTASGISAGISVTDWTNAVIDGGAIVVDGLSTGTGAGTGNAWTPAEGTKFRFIMSTMNYVGSTEENINVDMTYSGGAWSMDNPVYWDNLTADKYDIYGQYIPSATNANGERDFLVAYPHNVTLADGSTVAVNTVKRGDAIRVTLDHVMAQVKFNLTSKDGSYSADQLAGATLTMSKFARFYGLDTFNFDPTTWVASGIDGINVPKGFTVGKDSSALTGAKDGDAAVFSSTICPQEWFYDANGNNTVATLTVGGVTYNVKMNKTWTFKPGTITTVNLDVKKTGIEVAEGGITVTDWTDGGSFDGSVEL